MEFIAVDVETANPDLSSICQIGLVAFRDGQILAEVQTLVNPEDYFDELNVMIHGIDEAQVEDAPTLPELASIITQALSGNVAACHTFFDRVAVTRAFEKYQLTPPECRWLDTAKVTRRAWPEVAKTGYGLASIAEKLGIKFRHHEAQEDARAAGLVLIRAIETTGITLDEWFDRVRRPIDLASQKPITREGNPDGPLYGEVVIFTGSLSIPRREAADLAATAGCRVATGVSSVITILVVGDQDIRKLRGQTKSSKHRSAEELIAQGHAIRILRESDFRQLVQADA
jgi:DNA polymerase-3 subunit epsilon